MYSCSTGSIQSAIKKLLRHGYIDISEVTEKGKLKKFYTITDSGKKCFHDWLCRPIDNGATKNPELSKIYFLGFAEKETRLKLIENHIDGLKKMLSDLKKICDDGATLLNENKNR